MVRIAAEQLADTPRFPVRQTKGAVQRLCGQLRQVIQCNRGHGEASPHLVRAQVAA
jgi:hypothetical protein